MKRTIRSILSLALAIACLVGLGGVSFAQHTNHTNAEASCPDPNPNLRPGDYGYAHDCYHEIYKTLNKGSLNYWDSCCKGHECRVTEDIQDAPPELKARGIDYLVVVGGRVCHATVKEEVRLSEAQRKLAKTNPLYRSFLEHTHVCDSDLNRPPRIPRPPGTSPTYDAEEAAKCSTISCIVVGPRS